MIRIEGTDGVVLVKYKTVIGTALAATDFIIADGELLFQDGVAKQTIRINIIDDRIKEPNETFSVILYQPAGIEERRLGQTTSLLVTIIDNDSKIQLFFLICFIHKFCFFAIHMQFLTALNCVSCE